MIEIVGIVMPAFIGLDALIYSVSDCALKVAGCSASAGWLFQECGGPA